MKIVIDISAEYYDALKKVDMILAGRRNGKTLESAVYNAVGKGIPLAEIFTEIKAEIGDIPRGILTPITEYNTEICKIIDKYIGAEA